MAEEDFESPWNETPEYKNVPPVNPKTGEPIAIFLCKLCGGAVLNRNIHTEAHQRGLLR